MGGDQREPRSQGTVAGERGFTVALGLVLLLCVLTIHKGQIDGDGVLRWRSLTTLAEEGRLTTDKYSIVLPLAAMPLYLAGRTAARILGATPDERVSAAAKAVRRFNGLVAVATALAFFAYLRRVLHWRRGRAVAATGFLVFGSLLLPHARDFYAECLWTFLSALALWTMAVVDGSPDPRRGAWRSLLLVLLVAVLVPLNPVLGIVFAILAAIGVLKWQWQRQRNPAETRWPKAAVVTALGVVAGVGLTATENWVRRGSVTDFGYPGEGFSTPLLHGLLGQLVAPARGILFFIPALVAALWWRRLRAAGGDPRHRLFVDYCLLYSASLVLVYAKWHAWHGAWYWGPRFLLPLSIVGAFSLVVVAHHHWATAVPAARTAWAVLAVLSVAVYKVGAAVNQRHLLECLRTATVEEACYWDLRYSPVASWLDPADLVRLVSHRSFAVEVVTVLLLTALVRWWPEPDPLGASRELTRSPPR